MQCSVHLHPQQALTDYLPTYLPHGGACTCTGTCTSQAPATHSYIHHLLSPAAYALTARLLTAPTHSFGDPNARPPTPQPTPTAVLSSPLLQTPKQNSSHFDETSGWTPRFAEEYSVFNSTPGNLRSASSASGTFNLDFAPLSPVPPSTGKKRPLSAGAVDIAPHVNHLASDSATIPPVDPARRLLSSPDPLTLSHKGDAATPSNPSPAASDTQQEQEGQRSAKKPRRASVSGAAGKSPFFAQRQTQTATPPPSSRGGRKLAPKPQIDNMQHEAFQAPGFSSAPPPLNTAFVTGNPDDVFGYSMGPATAPPITAPRPFWGFNMDTTAMDASGMAIDVDLSAAGADLFQTSTQHVPERPMTSMEWGRANFQQTSSVARSNQQHQQQLLLQSQYHEQDAHQNQSSRRERPLAPKAANMSTSNISQSPNQDLSFGSFHMMDNPYNTSPGGVDPGLLFSQPSSSAPMDSSAISTSVSMDSASQYPAPEAPANMANPTIEPVATISYKSAGKDPQRSGSQRKGQGQGKLRKKPERVPAISPAKDSDGRPDLSRSFSESARGGKRTVGGARNPLPTLAPARHGTAQQSNLPPPAANQGSTRPPTQGKLFSGRTSPPKLSQHHRLSSLTSIPENASDLLSRSARTASVKFVIDENGRAHTETVVTDDEDEYPESDPVLMSSSKRGISGSPWGTSLPVPVPGQDFDEEYSSSSDDEPIIIPSRNTSFNLPEPQSSSSGNSRPPTAGAVLSQNRQAHRSFSDRPLSSLSRVNSLMNPDRIDSMDIDRTQPQRPSTGSSLGDAAAELRKVMQACNPRQLPPTLGSSGSSVHRQRFISGQRSSSSTISESSLPATSPIGGREQSQIRCVCSRPEAGDGVFLIKW